MLNLLPPYSQIFDEPEDLETILRSLPKKASIFIVSSVSAQLEANWKQIDILKFFFRKIPHEHNPIRSKLKSFFSSTRSKFIVFSEFHINLLLIKIIEHSSTVQDDTTPKEDLLLFKAYLLVIEEYLQQQEEMYNGAPLTPLMAQADPPNLRSRFQS